MNEQPPFPTTPVLDTFARPNGGTPPTGIKTQFGLAYLHEGMAYRESLNA